MRSMLNRLIAGLMMLLSASVALSHAANAGSWRVDPAASRIGFAGTHAGRAFEGRFEDWSAEITFDPGDLESAKADVRIRLGSAVTGDVTYDKTLPTVDWFNIAVSPEARFVTTAFKKAGDGAFVADGTLAIRGFEVPVALAFTFARTGEGTGAQTARITGSTTLQRLDFAIGKDSDASGGWVSLAIPVTVDVVLVAD